MKTFRTPSATLSAWTSFLSASFSGGAHAKKLIAWSGRKISFIPKPTERIP